jgi:hypothetical protein
MWTHCVVRWCVVVEVLRNDGPVERSERWRSERRRRADRIAVIGFFVLG